MKSGLFISFEGCEGSGKTSIIDRVFEDLTSKGYNVVKTREPGGVKLAEDIRHILLNKEYDHMDPISEVLLFASSRRAHLIDKIIPKLENNFIVLSDRFIDSSLAYQSYGGGAEYDFVYNVNKYVIGEYFPDLTIFVDCPPSVGMTRINKDKEREINRLDLEKLEYHNRVYEGYLEISKKENRISTVNGENVLDEVVKDTLDLIYNKMNELNYNK